MAAESFSDTSNARPVAHNRSSLTNALVIAVFTAIILTVFLTQSGGVGFWDSHHGWVSSHGLAIMSRATPENGFVGHALTFREEDGSFTYSYFDRYPFFFSAFMGAILHVTDNLGTQVFLARQVMNVIFVLTIFAAFRLVRRLIANPLLALGVVVLAFSSARLNYYRDMIHYDQPALLGLVVLLYAITITKQECKIRWIWLYVAAIAAVSMGRGYASFFVMGVWFLLEAVGLLLNHKRSLWQRIKAVFAHDATRIMVIGVLWGGAFMGYNIVSESLQRDIPIQKTSIISSALRRLPRDATEGTSVPAPIPPWNEFTAITFDRILQIFLPGKYPVLETGISVWSYVFSLIALGVVIYSILRQPPAQRVLMSVIAFSGLVWIFFMANLTYHHDYTVMYALGFALVFYLTLAGWLQRYRVTAVPVLLFALLLFVATNMLEAQKHGDRKRGYSVYTEDYNRILHTIGTGHTVYDTFLDRCGAFNLQCHRYMRGFYLGDNYIARHPGDADYIVTAQTYYVNRAHIAPDNPIGIRLISTSLTPDNQFFHVFDAASAEIRYLPDDISDQLHFGDRLTLQQWELRDSVNVQPCQRINIESWWRTSGPLPDDLSLQIAMVNTSGQDVAASNHFLSQLPTRLWNPNNYHFDVSIVQIPCDAVPGEYPLVMSVYDSLTVFEIGSLPVTLPDGTPFNDYVYLTTLFIR